MAICLNLNLRINSHIIKQLNIKHTIFSVHISHFLNKFDTENKGGQKD